jgi:hypothetical protein
MVINFKARGINRGMHNLIRTTTLIKKIINILLIVYFNWNNLDSSTD